MVWNYSTNLYIVKLHLFLTSAFFDSKKQDFSSLKFLGSSFVYDLSRLLKFLPSDIPEERKCIRYDLYSYSAQPTHLFVFKLVSTDDWVGLSSQRRGGVRKIDQPVQLCWVLETSISVIIQCKSLVTSPND